MKLDEVVGILAEVERQLAGVLPAAAEAVVQKLLNLVEQLVAEQRGLLAEVQRLRELLEQKKRSKTTAASEAEPPASGTSDHSSEEQRRKREPPAERPATDRRTFKALAVHEERECPVDPRSLPPDAVRMADEAVIVQDIRIEPRNIRFARHVYYSAVERRWIRGALPAGYGQGDFGPELRALIVALKYCGNMSEPKIRELLDNFQVQISSGSVSNILTGTAEAFADDYHAVFLAGLSSTAYQQTDDTSARVAGQFWHTHILCNPFYTFYATHPHKDRLTILAVLQNQHTQELRFRFDATTRQRLKQEELPLVWQQRVATLGDVTLTTAELQALLDTWFDPQRQPQARLDIEQAAALAYYRQQTDVPVIQTLVCDDAKQFKQITDHVALCWIHAGRHYARLSPVAPSHAAQLAAFQDRFWDYYAALQRYRDGPSPTEADRLRREFETLFSTRTGYDALDDRIAKTQAKQSELLTVLSCPKVPLHNNDSELGARVSARRRDVSLHSKSIKGVRAMDIFTTLVQTCKKLGLSAYAYLRDRFSHTHQLPSLASLIPAAAGA
jgi:Transposase IS66 family